MSSISAGGATRYTITGVNAREQLTAATYGSSLNASYGFDSYGYPSSAQTGSVQDYRYSFDFYTGNLSSRENHEHLPWFNLINMNGRLYDPLVGRFLSPDNEISSPGSTQGYNRYAYCRNNPLIASDPDGNNPVLIAAIILGGIMNAQQAMMNSTKTSFGGIMGDIGKGWLVGALAGAVGYWAGSGVASSFKYGGFEGGFLSGAAGGGAGGFVMSSGNAWMNGESFNEGLNSGFNSGIIGGITGGIVGGLLRGIDDYSNGYTFGNGTKTEGFVIGQRQPSENIINNYNGSDSEKINTEMLKIRTEDEFGDVKKRYNIRNVTTKTSNGFRLTSSGLYTQNNQTVDGYHVYSSSGYSSIHISPAITGSPLPEFSEGGAYRYSYDVYKFYGLDSKADQIMNFAKTNGYWCNYLPQYRTPF